MRLAAARFVPGWALPLGVRVGAWAGAGTRLDPPDRISYGLGVRLTLGARAVQSRSFLDACEKLGQHAERPLAPGFRIGLALEILALRFDQRDRVDHDVGRDFFVDGRNAHCAPR